MGQQDKQNQGSILQIGVIGGYSRDTENGKLQFSRFDKVINDVLKFLAKRSNEPISESESDPILRFITAVDCIEEELLDAISQTFPNSQFMCVAEHYRDSIHPVLKEGLTVLYEGVQKEEGTVKSSLIYSWLCDQADFVIVMEDEKNQKYQELAKYCKYVSVPSVIIYNSLNRHILWAEASAYDSYDNDKLEAYLEYILKIEEELHLQEEERSFFLRSPLWGGMYNRYMKKNKDKTGAVSVTADKLVTDEGNLEKISQGAEKTRSKLYQIFNFYDQQAIKYSNNYHSSIYLRAVIPLAVTIVLAVGFYSETIFGFWKLQINGYLSFWSIVAGAGFFLHALLNLYIYVLSENKVIQSWHKNFIDHRLIAEALRLAIHFVPFGIPINCQVQVNKYGAKSKNNLNSVRKLKGILKTIGMPETKHNSTNMSICIDHLEELMNDQLNYHKRSANQYARIYEKLKRYGKIIFYIGFIFVMFRGMLQLYISFHPIPEQSLAKACANMLALIFPVWAAYFSSKVTLCNFEGLYNNHRNMMDEIQLLKQKINDEQQKDRLTYADLYYLSRDITSVILGDVSEWYSQVNARKVTRL